MQQELAADARAATVVGSRQSYLNTLAKMALRADEQPIPWAARAFLPSTSLLVRRITWLKRNPLQEQIMSRKSRWILAVTMAVIAALVAGIRGPNSAIPRADAADERQNKIEVPVMQASSNAVAQSPAAGRFIESEGASEQRNLYVPADAEIYATISPKRIIDGLPPTAQKIGAMLENRIIPGFALTDFAEIQLVGKTVQPGTMMVKRAVVRTVKPFDWLEFLSKHPPKISAKRFADKTYHSVAIRQDEPAAVREKQPWFPQVLCFITPNDHTLVVATEDEMHKILAGGERLMDSSELREIAGSPLGMIADGNWLRRLFGVAGATNPLSMSLRPSLERTNRFAMLISFDPIRQKANESTIQVNAILSCDSEDGAKEVGKTIEAIHLLATNFLWGKEQAAAQRRAHPRPDLVTTGELETIRIANQLLKAAKISSAQSDVHVQSSILVTDAMLAETIAPAIETGREAARRTQSMNNLKQLGLGMHVYADVYKHFPPPVLTAKDGKTKYSWRVALLPYLGDGKQLYDEYHFDEPWDSEHNRKLIDRMPTVFRDPHMPENSTSSAYYMITGKGTVGDSETGRKVREIVDGTARTIMLVDAKRDFPWTKPEDIEIDEDPSKPLPKLGGYLQDPWMFLVALADGSVQAIAPTVDEKVLRAYFTVSGRENAKFPLFNQ